MKPTAEMVERARALLRWNHDEFCEATIKHVHEIGGADVRYMTPGAECECKHRHIAQALADEHERAMERAAEMLDRVRAKQEQRLSPEPPTNPRMMLDQGMLEMTVATLNQSSAAIRAAAKGK